MISTILFDLNDVLVTYHAKDMDRQYLEEFGVDSRTFWQARKPYMRDYCLGKIDADQFMLGILKDLGISPDKLSRAHELHKKGVTLVEGITKLLGELKGRYRIVLIAGDGDGSFKFKLDNYGLRKYFDALYCTCYEGFIKSDPRLYEAVLKKENLRPEECLFIDDRENHTNVALGLGMKAIVFENTEKLRRQLKDMQIL